MNQDAIISILKKHLMPYGVGSDILSAISSDIISASSGSRKIEYDCLYTDSTGKASQMDIVAENDIEVWNVFKKIRPNCNLIYIKEKI